MTSLLFACGGQSTPEIVVAEYPATRYDSTVVEDYHGTMIADPFRWLEDDRSEETAHWVSAQNKVTQDYLSHIPFRKEIENRLTELYNYPKEGAPFRQGDYYFFFRNDGLQNQSVLYFQKGLDGTPEVFLDPNTLSQDGTVALGGISFSQDDEYMAYTTSASGSDWVQIQVMEVESKKLLPDLVKWVKFSGAAWGEDGFYYSRYDEPTGSALSAKNEYQKVYFHKLGTTQSEDKLIYEDKEHPLRYFTGSVSDDNEWLFVTASEGTHGTELLYKEVGSKEPFKVLFEGFKYDYSVVDCRDDKLLVLTNDGAPNFRLIEVDLESKELAQRVVVPQSDDLLQWVSTAGEDALFVGHLVDASTQVTQYNWDGKLIRKIDLPGIGTAGGFSGKKDDQTIFYSFTSFNVPPTYYQYDIEGGESTLYRQTEVNFDVTKYTVEQVFYPSKDGTKVPMFLVYKKGLERNGNAPTLLYAYGGFNISLTPSFSPSNILLLEQGGIYALANLRGGGEYGEEWHKGGMLENKQNVFDDFIAAAEYLIEEKYTSTEKLAISGGSNGGLLVGACLTQRPDLFSVAFPQVGVLDMLRYHKFTIGWGWVVEYGSADVKEDFDYLIKYSPLHNIHKGTCYPATMVMTADHDDRVVPAHSFKFAATLQAAQGCDKPTLIRIDANAGHGAGKPISKVIESAADYWSFMLQNTNSGYTISK